MTLQQSSQSRIQSIDILRGFALLGIALVHMIEQYYAGQIPDAIIQASAPTIADHVAQGFAGLFITGKFYMIFSFLFGLSFFMQFSKRDDRNFLLRYAWRLLILFAIGMIHHLHYRGDILGIYALLGFSLIILHKLPDRALLILAVTLVLNIPSVVTRTVQLFAGGESNNLFNADQEALMAYHETLKSGTYLQILKANLAEFTFKMNFQVWSGRIYITLGLFLLGVYAGRKNVFKDLSRYLPFFRTALRYSLISIGATIVAAVVIFGSLFAMSIQVSQELGWLIGGFFFDVFNTALAIIYVSGILLLLQREKWRRRLMIFFPVGKMGLTMYLMQTAFGTFIFFSYGLGLLSDIGAFTSFVLGLTFFVVQAAIARSWFRHFSFGPVEWIWRNLTYLRIQKLRVTREPA